MAAIQPATVLHNAVQGVQDLLLVLPPTLKGNDVYGEEKAIQRLKSEQSHSKPSVKAGLIFSFIQLHYHDYSIKI